MTGEQVREQLAIIEAMVARSRRETAESGHFFIWIGLIGIVTVFIIRWLESGAHARLALPALAAVFVANGVVGYLALAVRQKRTGARSYPASVCSSVWLGCGTAALVAVVLLPALGAIPWSLAPALAALIMGVGVLATGSIFEVPAIAWSSLVWWGGSVAMALVSGASRAYVMAVVLLLGMVVPGIILNRRSAGLRGGDEH